MTFAPRTLLDLGAYWTNQGGVNLGIVGDVNHTIGYHLGRDRIYGPMGQGDDDYSVQHRRDKAGLTNAAAAIDLGKLGFSYDRLQDFSSWLVTRCQDKAAGTQDIREIIYSPDGYRVQRYSGIDGAIHTGPGNGDASHRTHTHISYFRDSEARDKVAVFAAYWEDDMKQPVITNLTPVLMDIAKGATFYAVDAETPAGTNALERIGVRSDYGSYTKRSWVFDPDGTGDDTKRSLYWVVPAATSPVPAPEPPAPSVQYRLELDGTSVAEGSYPAPVDNP